MPSPYEFVPPEAAEGRIDYFGYTHRFDPTPFGLDLLTSQGRLRVE
jgi:hypothetical protein